MKVTLYGIKNCSTMRQAKVFLTENKIQFDFVDYKNQKPTKELIEQFFKIFGWENVINTKGLTWRKLSAEERENLDETKALNLLIKYPTMIKRPIVSKDNNFYLGMDNLKKII